MNNPSTRPFAGVIAQQYNTSHNGHTHGVFSFLPSRNPAHNKDQLDQGAPIFLHRCLVQTTWLVSALCLMLLLLIQSSVAAASIEGPQSPSDTGIGMLYSQHSGEFESMPLLHTSATLEVAGIVSTVIFKQSFSNHSTETIEGLYVFPLPDDAAIRELKIHVGQRTILAMIKERAHADKLYKLAKENGRVAGIVKQQRPNLFSLAIANIAPGERIDVELEYLQTVQISDNRYSIRIPLTLTSRYSNQQVQDVAAITPMQTSSVKAQSHSFELNARIRTTSELSVLGSNSHSLHYTQDTSGYQITLASVAALDRDIELHWSPKTIDTPTVSIFSETVDGENFILGLLKPPLSDSDPDTLENPLARSLARELVMVIDTSGSMAGEPIETAIHALQDALHGLSETDYFNIIAFSDRTRQLFPASRIATPDHLESARDFISQLHADGGTEMMPALRAAARQSPGVPEELVRQIVFITDGAVGYEEQVFAQIARTIGESRLFTVGIGQAPNGYFMKRAALSGRGTYTFIADAAQVGTAMRELFRKLENPVMKDLSIQWIGDAGELAVPRLRDLHAGEPLVFSARLGQSTSGFKVSGLLGNQRWETQVLLSSPPNATSNSADRILPGQGISTIWAREKISSLMREYNDLKPVNNDRSLTHNMARVDEYTVSGANREIAAHELVRMQVVDLALSHKLMTPFTSLIAIDEMVTRAADDPLKTAEVPNLLPAGQMTRINLPQGATGIDGLWLLSASCFALALLLGGLIFRIEYLSFEDIA